MRREVPSVRVSPETYLGPRGWTSFANRAGMPDARLHHYVAPRALPADSFALAGEWQLVDGERQVLRSGTGAIRYQALAGEVNLVLGVDIAQVSGPSIGCGGRYCARTGRTAVDALEGYIGHVGACS